MSPSGGVSRRRGVPTGSARSQSDDIGTVGPKAIVDSRGCNTSCCCCSQTSPGGDAVQRRIHRRGAGEPSETGADAVGPVVSTESVSCVGLLEGVGWETSVAAAGASAEPVPTSVGAAKTEANRCRQQAKPARGRGRDRRWRRLQKHERRTSPKEQSGRQASCLARVRENRNYQRR